MATTKAEKPPAVEAGELVHASKMPVVLASLPGETKADQTLIDEAVQAINHATDQAELGAALEVGRFIIEKFFSGDAESYVNRGRAHASLVKLAQRDDLHVSAQWLWSACNVAVQYPSLPEHIRDALSLSHHRALLPLKNEKKKLALATQAAEKGWSKVDLKAKVDKERKQQGPEGRTGRPPVPAFLKSLSRINSLSTFLDEEIDWAEPFPGYTDEGTKKEQGKAQAVLDEAEQQLTAMLKFVKEAKRKLK